MEKYAAKIGANEYGIVFRSTPNGLSFALKYYFPRTTRAFLRKLLRIGQAPGSDIVRCELDVCPMTNVSDADQLLSYLVAAGAIRCAGICVDFGTRVNWGLEYSGPRTSAVYPHEGMYVPQDRMKIIEAITEITENLRMEQHGREKNRQWKA